MKRLFTSARPLRLALPGRTGSPLLLMGAGFTLMAGLLLNLPGAEAAPVQVESTASEGSLTSAYSGPAGQILGAALTDQEAWNKLRHLTTVIGHRLSGSEGLEEAIRWAEKTMIAEGLKVTLEPVKVPHWVRGQESVEVLPSQGVKPRELNILGLGGSVGTGPDGVSASVAVVRDWAELDALGRSGVEGRIVVFAVEWEGYGRTVQYRALGASRAAALGAVGALVRSATGHSLNTPHTGSLRYSDGDPKIPAAAITPEDAAWFLEAKAAGLEVKVRIQMDAETFEDADSFNVIAEIPGSEKPDEVVVMGGHFDSWDVGHGAHDDGAACIAAWHALTLIHQLGLQPKRTLRVVLWTNEENGLAGGNAYREGLGDDVSSHVAALEMDGGAERPRGFGFSLPGASTDGDDERYESAYSKLVQIGALLEGIEAHEVFRGGGGADIGPLMKDGVPGLGLRTVGEHYFDWHHTRADTLDKVEPLNLRRNMAVLGIYGFVLADMDERLSP